MTTLAVQSKSTEVSKDRVVGTYLVVVCVEVCAFRTIQSGLNNIIPSVLEHPYLPGFGAMMATVISCITMLLWATAFLAKPHRNDYTVVNLYGTRCIKRGFGYDAYNGSVAVASTLTLYLVSLTLVPMMTTVLASIRVLLS